MRMFATVDKDAHYDHSSGKSTASVLVGKKDEVLIGNVFGSVVFTSGSVYN